MKILYKWVTWITMNISELLLSYGADLWNLRKAVSS